MADYLLLYEAGGGMPETEEEQAAVMQAWTDWFTSLGGAVKDGGNPTSPAAKQVAADGAVSDIASTASGYSILTAGSLEEAAEMARGCPVLAGGMSVTVLETFDVM